MQKTLLEIQRLLVDVKGDAALLNLTPTIKKLEKTLQLLEGVVHYYETEDKFNRLRRIGQRQEHEK